MHHLLSKGQSRLIFSSQHIQKTNFRESSGTDISKCQCLTDLTGCSCYNTKNILHKWRYASRTAVIYGLLLRYSMDNFGGCLLRNLTQFWEQLPCFFIFKIRPKEWWHHSERRVCPIRWRKGWLAEKPYTKEEDDSESHTRRGHFHR